MALKSLTERFLGKVTRSETCWQWNGYTNEDGYGMFKLGKKCVRAHRVSWTLHFGEVPKDLHVLHRCDNRGCVNPAHLFLGTHQDNMRDRSRKGRGVSPPSHPGESHPSAKLNEEKVRAIRDRYIPRKVTMDDLAKEYGVCRQSISNIVHGKRWASHGS